MNNNTNYNAPIPVGFRFHPTDEELVGYYLYGKVGGTQLDQLIQELDLYKIEPWDLHEACRIGDDATENQSDWYFFSHKDKKYPTGNRANRATTAGFWKATGRDKPIHTQRQVIGMRKTLVFYKGRAPHGQKTDWIMHEFRLDDGPDVVPNYESDGWVVCRVFRKTKNLKTNSQDTSYSFEEDQHQLLPGKLERPAASAMKLVYNDNVHLQQQHHSFTTNNPDFTCKQEISVDDYSASIQDTPSFLQDPALMQQHLHDQELHMRLHPAASLASCSSSRFHTLQQAYRSRADQDDEYSIVPLIPTNSFRDGFDDARSTGTLEASAFPLLQHEENTYWMQQLVRGRHP